MSTYFVRQDGQTAMGPYDSSDVAKWLADGRLPRDAECSPDGRAWSPVTDVSEFAAAVPPRAAAKGGFPEPALYVRQGLNVQGPFAMSRIRGYVAQRRVQPYMLFSQDRVWWVAPEHVPGLIPDGYVPVTPSRRPSAVPEGTPGAVVAAAPASTVRPAPVASADSAPAGDVGSITLTGFRLDEVDAAPPSSQPVARLPVAAPIAPPFAAPVAAPRRGQSYYLRQDATESYGPYAEEMIRNWIADGRVSPDMEFSIDGKAWIAGSHIPGLFPPDDGAGPASRPSKGWRDRR